MSRRLPEHQFAYWFARESFRRLSSWLPKVWRPAPLPSLATFSREYSQCLKAGLPVADAFEKCRLVIESRDLKHRWRDVRRRMIGGDSIAESLQDAEAVLPAFFIPAVAAGERSGRVDEVFLFLANHLRLLVPLSNLLRKLWLYPVVIITCGSLARSLLLITAGNMIGGLQVVFGTGAGILWYLFLAAVAWLTPARMLFDTLRLRIPWIGRIEHDLATQRFFSVMSLLERAQCDRMDEMIRISASTVSNQALIRQLGSVIDRLGQQATLGEAFSHASYFEENVRQMIDSSEKSGTLLEGYSYLALQAENRLTATLNWVQLTTTKIVSVVVMYCLIMEAFRFAFAH